MAVIRYQDWFVQIAFLFVLVNPISQFLIDGMILWWWWWCVMAVMSSEFIRFANLPSLPSSINHYSDWKWGLQIHLIYLFFFLCFFNIFPFLRGIYLSSKHGKAWLSDMFYLPVNFFRFYIGLISLSPWSAWGRRKIGFWTFGFTFWAVRFIVLLEIL